MKLKVLGCYGTELLSCKMTGFLINDRVVLDAGTIESSMTMAEQVNIASVLLSHTHLDHTKGVAFLADNVCNLIQRPVDIVGTTDLIQGIRDSLLNNVIWPDFTVIPTPESPTLRYREIPEDAVSEVDGLHVRPVRVNHPVPTMGFIIRDGRSTLVYSGDTGPTEDIWKRANDEPSVSAIMIEASFPNRLESLARISGHLTPRLLALELEKVRHKDAPVYVYHLKPRYIDELTAELRALNNPRIRFMEDDRAYEI
ncbi:MAG: 3',5'-cyclic-nucleotide phosphodiesterase [Nitrospirota bacterium]